MTEENYLYRTSQTMLRNQFPGDGPFQIPIIPKAVFTDEDFRDLLLIGFDRARATMTGIGNAWSTFSSTTTNLSGYGRMQKRIWTG